MNIIFRTEDVPSPTLEYVWIGCDDQAILAVVSHIIVTCMSPISSLMVLRLY